MALAYARAGARLAGQPMELAVSVPPEIRERLILGGWRIVDPLPFLDTYRTMYRAPEAAFRQVLEDIREFRFSA